MKKTLLLIAAPIIFLSALSAQVTQAQADSIVLERMSQEMQVHTIFAKDGVQTETTITFADGEIFELEYPCFVYFIRYAEETNDKFLIVNENNGNLLEIRTQGNAEPEDLEEWRIVEVEIDFCSFVNAENIGRIIPIMNEFLNNLPFDAHDETKLNRLATWLKTHSCITDAKALSYLRPFRMRPLMYELAISFEERDSLITFIFETSANPLKIESYFEYLDANKYDLWSYIDPNDMNKAIPVINEFLHNLPANLTVEQEFHVLERWLLFQNIWTETQCHSCIKTNPPTAEIRMRLPGGRFFSMGVLRSQPMIVTGFLDRIYEQEDVVEPIKVMSLEYLLVAPTRNIDWSRSNWNQHCPSLSETIFNPIIINSYEELRSYATCDIKLLGIPEVDFTKHSLLLTFGISPGGMLVNTAHLHKYLTGYVLYINVDMFLTQNIVPWHVVFVTDKLLKESYIEIRMIR